MKYTAMIVGVTSMVSIVLGMFLLNTVRENSRMLELEADFNDVLQAQLADADSKLVWGMGLAFFFFNVALAMLAVFVTHRMAGPIFVMERYVRELGEGRLPRVRKLRKGDEFVELVDAMSETVKLLEDRMKGEVSALEGAISKLGPEHPAVGEVQTVLEAKKKTLADRTEETLDLAR